MSFNSTTYWKNKHRRDAWKYLEEAREIARRVKDGLAYSWEPASIPARVKLARTEMHLHLTYRRIAKERAR